MSDEVYVVATTRQRTALSRTGPVRTCNEVAKKKGIAGRSQMGKWDLIRAIRKAS